MCLTNRHLTLHSTAITVATDMYSIDEVSPGFCWQEVAPLQQMPYDVSSTVYVTSTEEIR